MEIKNVPRIGNDVAIFWEELLEELYESGDYPDGFSPDIWESGNASEVEIIDYH